MKNNDINFANIFKAISDQTRLKIIEMLKEKAMCACDILDKVAIGQSTLSYHMKILNDNNLVISTPRGSWVWYSLNQDVFENIKNYLSFLTNRDEDFNLTTNCNCRKSSIIMEEN